MPGHVHCLPAGPPPDGPPHRGRYHYGPSSQDARFDPEYDLRPPQDRYGYERGRFEGAWLCLARPLPPLPAALCCHLQHAHFSCWLVLLCVSKGRLNVLERRF